MRLMESLSAQHRLFRSCEILFGSELTISGEFLDYLQLGGLKTAYRKRALETHPDRQIVKVARSRGWDSFHRVQEAYENLLDFLNSREKAGGRAYSCPPEAPAFAPERGSPASPRDTGRTSGHSPRQRPFARRTIKPIILPHEAGRGALYTNTDSLYRGPLPQRPLLFGHFLYYSGLSNWRTIARILIWQRIERPRLGELGRRNGIFSQEDIARILRSKVPPQPFGQTARLLGMVTDFQLQALVSQQRRLQKKFGTILVEKNLVNNNELRELLFQFKHHNAGISRQPEPARWP